MDGTGCQKVHRCQEQINDDYQPQYGQSIGAKACVFEICNRPSSSQRLAETCAQHCEKNTMPPCQKSTGKTKPMRQGHGRGKCTPCTRILVRPGWTLVKPTAVVLQPVLHPVAIAFVAWRNLSVRFFETPHARKEATLLIPHELRIFGQKELPVCRSCFAGSPKLG